MPRSKSIIILLFLISTITSKQQLAPSYSSRVALYLINRPVHNCLRSLNYYKNITLKGIRNKMLSVQNLYDLAIRDLNETSSHNLRLLDDNGYGGPQDEIERNCAECAARSKFSIIINQTELDIMDKFSSNGDPDTLEVYQAYSRNKDEGREKMCHFIENYGLSILEMGEQSLNESEIEYIHLVCEYYLS